MLSVYRLSLLRELHDQSDPVQRDLEEVSFRLPTHSLPLLWSQRGTNVSQRRVETMHTTIRSRVCKLTGDGISEMSYE